jgi:hypothetical protein
MASPVFFLQFCLFFATGFQFRTWSRETASFCTFSYHLLLGVLAFFLQNFLLKSSLGCDSLPSLWLYQPIWVFIQIHVERGISLYTSCSSSWYLILHALCEWVGLNIFWRIFRLKNQFYSLMPKYCKWGFYIMLLRLSSWCHEI